jgi:hypothetical protein
MLILLFCAVSPPVLASTSPSIFPPDSKPYGLAYTDHAQNFWQWLLSIPASQNPTEDLTGERCMNGQENSNSSVVYLSPSPGGKAERECIVPTGKGLLIPVMVMEISDKEAPGSTVEDLHNAATKDQDGVNSLYLNVDNAEYTFDDLTNYRIHTNVFEVVWPDNGAFGVREGGPSNAVADGHYIITEPLTSGNHSIHYKSSLSCPDPVCIEPVFAQDVKYNIIAK